MRSVCSRAGSNEKNPHGPNNIVQRGVCGQVCVPALISSDELVQRSEKSMMLTTRRVN